MSSSPSPLDSFDAASTLGVLEIGVLISYLLFGISTTQVYIYFSRFPNDSKRIKCLVVFIWLCEIGNAICFGIYLYNVTIQNFGNPAGLLGQTPASFLSAMLFAVMAEVSVQSFFAWRIYSLSNSLIVPCALWALAFTRLVFGISSFVLGLSKSWEESVVKLKPLAMSTWSISVAVDVTITVSLVFLLWRQRTKAVSSTMAIVDRIIAWTIQTGMATSAFSICTLATYAALDQQLIWVAFFAIETRVFSNSMLASLNARSSFRTPSDKNELSLPHIHTTVTVNRHIVSDRGQQDEHEQERNWESEFESSKGQFAV